MLTLWLLAAAIAQPAPADAPVDAAPADAPSEAPADSGGTATTVELAPIAESGASDDPATAPRPGIGARLGLKASLRAGAWTHDRDLGEAGPTAVGALRLRAGPRAGRFDAFAEGYVQGDSVRGFRGDAVEAWGRWTAGSFELRGGRLIPVWGRADRLNPSDVLTSRDYTLLVASDDEQRRGSAMVQARLGLGALTLDAYWLPEFRGNVFPIDRRRPGVVIVADARPRDNAQFAVKLDRSGGRVDWSLGWFHGIDRTRDFVAVAVPPGSPLGTLVAVQQQFPKVDVFAADAAGTWGRIGWRAEIAYSRYRGADDAFRKNDNLWLVAGVDTTLAGGVNVNLQYSFRRIFDYSDPRRLANPLVAAVAAQSAAVNNQLDETQNGVTFRIARKWLQDTLDSEISAIAFAETGDAAIRPKLTYAIDDHVRVTAGGDVFLGPALSYFGRVRRLSAFYVQITRGF
ncbi:hypothetical protein IP88_12090 [alpha proteobacterium AAP81b]|nr:hypothetical protein IP88_12090 [alpha proteobacterium AAP81b]